MAMTMLCFGLPRSKFLSMWLRRVFPAVFPGVAVVACAMGSFKDSTVLLYFDTVESRDDGSLAALIADNVRWRIDD